MPRACNERMSNGVPSMATRSPSWPSPHKETLLRVMRCGASAYATKLTQGALMSLFPKFKRRDPLGASPEFGSSAWLSAAFRKLQALLFLLMSALPIPLVEVPIDTAMLVHGIILLRHGGVATGTDDPRRSEADH